ncbi:MAG: hypothetical protein M3525_16450 [Acidobacteriota bacterium]|nr:hypothetical protein [Acidobacteriota bacterium]
MPEKPKNENDKECEPKNSPENKPEIGDADSWSQEQRERSYYYDDAHGYEIYNPDEDDEDEDE